MVYIDKYRIEHIKKMEQPLIGEKKIMDILSNVFKNYSFTFPNNKLTEGQVYISEEVNI